MDRCIVDRIARPYSAFRAPHSPFARWLLATLLACVALTLGGGGRPVAAAAGPPGRELPSWVEVPEQVYFPQTGHHLAEPFLFYWRTNGGLPIFGLPITEALTTADRRGVIQYFERVALEFRPNTGGATELAVGHGATTNTEVNLRTGPGTSYGKVGELRSQERLRVIGGPLPDARGELWYQIAGPFGAGWSKGEYLERQDSPIGVATRAVAGDDRRLGEPPFRPLAPIVLGALGPNTPDLAVFPTTGHTLTGVFKRFWEARGGVTIFGLPLSEPFNEVSPFDGKSYLVQYFEHAKLEYHPEEATPERRIQLAALGRHAAGAARVPTERAARLAGTPDYNEELFLGPKWIEVSLTEQRMTTWDGDTPRLTTLVRTGKKGWQTPVGTHRIFRKLPTDDMTLGDPGDEDYYYIRDVPWVMYFLDGGFAIHGADWLDLWGVPTSRGCVNTPPASAAAIYEWAPLGTLVWVHH